VYFIDVRAGVDAPALPYPPTHRRVMLAHPASLEQRERSCGLLATFYVDVSQDTGRIIWKQDKPGSWLRLTTRQS